MFLLLIVLSTIANLVCSQQSTSMASLSTSTARVNTWDDLYIKPISATTELSRVCIVASRLDYKLSSSDSYTYIKYPSSYQATLTQATDVIDGAFRKAEMSISRVQITTNMIRLDINTVLKVLGEGTIQDRLIFLPSTLKQIASRGTDATSVVEEVSTQFKEAAAFFDELLRVVQPASGSTSTQTNKSPLDIDHATALSNILTDLKSLTVAWNQMAQISSNFASLANQVQQFVDDTKTLVYTLGEIAQETDLLSTLASLYKDMSTGIITPNTSSMAHYLTLDSEEQRLSEVQKVNKEADGNIPLTRQVLTETMDEYETRNTERVDSFISLADTLSA